MNSQDVSLSGRRPATGLPSLEGAQAEPPSAGRWWRNGRRGRRGSKITVLGVVVFYVAVIVFFWTTTAHFTAYANAVNIVSTASVLLIVSLGQSLTIISGGFDLSVGGVVPLGAVVYALLASSGMNPIVGILAVIGVGASVGALNAFVIGRIGINPLIATLGSLSVTSGLALTLAKGVTVQLPPSAGVLGNTGPGTIPYYTFVALGLAIVVHLLLSRTTLGRRVYVVGGNAEAARLAGIRVLGVQFAVYMISSMLAALAGIVYASELLAAAGNVGSSATLESIAAVVLGGAALTGGVGTIPGTVLGVLILGTVSNGMGLMRVPAFYEQIVTGVVLLVAVGFGRLQQHVTSQR